MPAENPYAAPASLAPLARRGLPGLGWAFAVGAAVGLAVVAYVAVDVCREPPRGSEFMGNDSGWNLRNLGWGVLYGLLPGLMLGSLATGVAACLAIVCGWARSLLRRVLHGRTP